MSTTEAPFVVSHNYCAIRANSVDELEQKLKEFVARPDVANLIAEFRSKVSMQGVTQGATVAQAVQAVTDAGMTAAVVSSNSGIEVQSDQWGNKYLRGNPDAGSCAHGPRIVKNGTNQSGKEYKAYVCLNDSPVREGKYNKANVCETAWPSR